MRIAAIDPGTTESALVQWDGERVLSAEICPNPELLCALRNQNLPYRLVIEQVESYGMAVGREVFETVLWSGRFFEAFEHRRPGMNSARMVPRRTVKLHLCNSMRAKDANIRQALIDRFGPPGTKKAPGVLYGVKTHLWAALALAVTAHDAIEPAKGVGG